jgi:hypothetical protein
MLFKPGHLHFHYTPLHATEVGYTIDLRYEIRHHSEHETVVHFEMRGLIGLKEFCESFELPRDMAYNFASRASRIAIRHGLPAFILCPSAAHRQYDLAFDDIREKLQAPPGTPVKPEHLL